MTKRLKAAERRASILAVAKVLFADRGFHGVSVDDIARRLGVSPAVLYRHFPSKEALYGAVLDEIACTRENYIDAVVDGPDDFASVLSRLTAVFVASIAADSDYLRMEMQAALEGNPATTRFFDSRWKSLTDYVEFSLKELARDGRAAHVHPVSAALMFQGIVREALYAKCIYQSAHYRDYDLDTLVARLIEMFLRAVGYREA